MTDLHVEVVKRSLLRPGRLPRGPPLQICSAQGAIRGAGGGALGADGVEI
jgi:hypothetical protein